jgi:hypothetical protein
LKAGLITQARANQLSADSTAHFNLQAIAARSLSTQLATLRGAYGAVSGIGATLVRTLGGLGVARPGIARG